MISAFRKSLDSWVARGFFLILVAVFVVWGVGDVLRNMGRSTWAARVGSQTIQPEVLADAYRRQLAAAERMFGGKIEPTPAIKRSVMQQALQQVVTQAALEEEEEARLRLTVPEAALQRALLDIPQFRGPTGQYDPAVARQVLQANNLTEADLARLIREEVGNRQLLESVGAGAGAPDVLTRAVFAFQQEKRGADYVAFPFAQATVAAPTDEQLQRWYDNHPDLYATPERRRIKAVVLSADTIARGIDVSDADVKAAYDQHAADFNQPEKRAVQMVLTQDEAKAAALAAQWRGGADWAAMQKAVKDAGGTGVELPASTKTEIPDPALADAVFAAQADQVSAPVKGDFGWGVFRVTQVVPREDKSFDQVKDEIAQKIKAEKAAGLLYDRANQLDNAFGGGADLDHVPSDIGAAGFLGTVTAQGTDLDGKPAPIPGSPAVRTALLAAAFQAHPNEPPHMQEVPPDQASGAGPAYYAVTVESIEPPAPKPFDEVKEKVHDGYVADARRHIEDEAAAKLLTEVKAGKSLKDAAATAGLAVATTKLTGRSAPEAGFPVQLLRPLFDLKPGEPTMIETPEAFLVAVRGQTEDPEPEKDPAGYAKLRDEVREAIATDVAVAFETGVRARAGVQVNRQVVDNIAQ